MNKNDESNKKSEIKTALIFITILILLVVLGLLSFWRFDINPTPYNRYYAAYLISL